MQYFETSSVNLQKVSLRIISGVRCQVSHIRCHMSGVTSSSDNVVELIGGGSVIKGAYPIEFIS